MNNMNMMILINLLLQYKYLLIMMISKLLIMLKVLKLYSKYKQDLVFSMKEIMTRETVKIKFSNKSIYNLMF